MWRCARASNLFNKCPITAITNPWLSPSVVASSSQYKQSSSVSQPKGAGQTNVKVARQTYSEKFPGFTPVFSFPYMRTLRIACRLKIYQTLVTCGCIPLALNWLSHGLITPPVLGVFTGLAAGAIVMLGAVGELSRKIVGILYINKSTEEVIISHMNFFGNRTDTRIELEDIIPISDTPESVDDVYWKIHTYSGRKFYVTTRVGGILDQNSFVKIFGDPNLGLKQNLDLRKKN